LLLDGTCTGGEGDLGDDDVCEGDLCEGSGVAGNDLGGIAGGTVDENLKARGC